MANKNPQNNAIQHGLTSPRVVLPQLGETEEVWEVFCNEWCTALKPRNGAERELVDRIAGLAWRLRRAEQYQLNVARYRQTRDDPEIPQWKNDYFDCLMIKPDPTKITPLTEAEIAEKEQLMLARELVVSDGVENARRYEISMERSLERNLKLYEKLRKLTDAVA